jgi:hypothetical protein
MFLQPSSTAVPKDYNGIFKLSIFCVIIQGLFYLTTPNTFHSYHVAISQAAHRAPLSELMRSTPAYCILYYASIHHV